MKEKPLFKLMVLFMRVLSSPELYFCSTGICPWRPSQDLIYTGTILYPGCSIFYGQFRTGIQTPVYKGIKRFCPPFFRRYRICISEPARRRQSSKASVLQICSCLSLFPERTNSVRIAPRLSFWYIHKT